MVRILIVMLTIIIVLGCNDVIMPSQPISLNVVEPNITGYWDVIFYTNIEHPAKFVFTETDTNVIGTLIDNYTLGYFVGKWNDDSLWMEKSEADWAWKLEAEFNIERTHFKGKWHIYHQGVYKDYWSIWGWKQINNMRPSGGRLP